MRTITVVLVDCFNGLNFKGAIIEPLSLNHNINNINNKEETTEMSSYLASR